MTDPKWGQRVNDKLIKERSRLNIPNQIFFLEDRARLGLFDADNSYLFEQVITRDDQLRSTITSKLRKKFAGKVQFLDTVGQARNLIKLYKLLILRRKRQHCGPDETGLPAELNSGLRATC